MADFNVEIVGGTGALPDYRVAVVAADASPRPDYVLAEAAPADFRVQIVATDATPLPAFRVSGISFAPLLFTSSLPSGVTYSRTGTVMAPDAAGLVTSFSADTAPRTDLGLLLETAGTNLALRSQTFDNAAWVKSAATVTADAAVAPDGTSTADLLAPSVANAQHLISQTVATPTGEMTFSVFLKAAGYSFARIRFTSGFGANNTIDLTTGQVGTVAAGYTLTSEAYDDGWWRLELTGPAVASEVLRINVETSLVASAGFAGDGTSGVYVWGAQLETGANASSYIATAAAAETRSLPTASIAAVPAEITRVRAIYGASLTSVLVGGLTPGGSLDLVTGRAWLGLGNELRSLEWVS